MASRAKPPPINRCRFQEFRRDEGGAVTTHVRQRAGTAAADHAGAGRSRHGQKPDVQAEPAPSAGADDADERASGEGDASTGSTSRNGTSDADTADVAWTQVVSVRTGALGGATSSSSLPRAGLELSALAALAVMLTVAGFALQVVRRPA
jgi:hypothetical protein